MPVTTLAALAVGLLLLFFLRRYFPNRRIFFVFAAVILAAAAFSFFSTEPPPRPAISPEERSHIIAQQQIIAEWYTEHQRLIGDLDHNWQQYHRTLTEFDADDISIETAYERLTELDAAAAEEEARVRKMEPPKALDRVNYDLVAVILSKTRAYAAAQRQAIHLTAAAADPQHLTSDVQEEQSRRLRQVMITESPAGLFTAAELTALRENLILPE